MLMVLLPRESHIYDISNLTHRGAFKMTGPLENVPFEITRLDKITSLQEKGITIFPSTFDRKDTISDIKTRNNDITHDKSVE
jgi:hypothetical protein